MRKIATALALAGAALATGCATTDQPDPQLAMRLLGMQAILQSTMGPPLEAPAAPPIGHVRQVWCANCR